MRQSEAEVFLTAKTRDPNTENIARRMRSQPINSFDGPGKNVHSLSPQSLIVVFALCLGLLHF